ncbi:MAG: site-specific integrase [Thermodesulfobacteriota bacterium]
MKNRLKVSAYTANKELQYLRALFNFGIKKKLIEINPTSGIEFFPIEKRKKYVPPKEDVLKVIATGDPEAQQYLWCIVLTAARVGEINQLTWDDVDFNRNLVTLWTRKRKGGNREPRSVPMIQKLTEILRHRFELRNSDIPWVFWHTYWDRKTCRWVSGPYSERKKLMGTLCTRAKVRYFRYHALRHLTASVLDDLGVPLGSIQRILGHQNRRTTEIYLHSIGEAERAAMRKLETTRLFQLEPSAITKAPTNMHVSFWNRKVEWPSYEILKQDIEQLGYCGTGRKYGVSNNAVKKWLKSYEKKTTLAMGNRVGTDSGKVTHKVTHGKE